MYLPQKRSLPYGGEEFVKQVMAMLYGRYAKHSAIKEEVDVAFVYFENNAYRKSKEHLAEWNQQKFEEFKQKINKLLPLRNFTPEDKMEKAIRVMTKEYLVGLATEAKNNALLLDLSGID